MRRTTGSRKLIGVNISNLAGVPSVVYGLLGLGVLVDFFGRDFLGPSIIAGGLTLGLLVLPIVIIASQEAIRAVPLSLRQAGFALGATPWQVARHHILPAAAPGILTGTILAVARAVGETAPLLVAGAALYITYVPNSPDGWLLAAPGAGIQPAGQRAGGHPQFAVGRHHRDDGPPAGAQFGGDHFA